MTPKYPVNALLSGRVSTSGLPLPLANAQVFQLRVDAPNGAGTYYTVPTGYSLMLATILVSNTTAGSLSINLRHTRGGVAYRLNGHSTSVNSAAQSVFNPFARVLIAGDSLTGTASGAGLNLIIYGYLVPVSSTANVTSAVISPTTAETVLYQVPSGKVAYIGMIAVNNTASTSSVVAANNSGGAATLTGWYLRSGESSANAYRLATTALTNDGNAGTISLPLILSLGDKIAVQSTSDTAGQTVALNIIEVDASSTTL